MSYKANQIETLAKVINSGSLQNNKLVLITGSSIITGDPVFDRSSIDNSIFEALYTGLTGDEDDPKIKFAKAMKEKAEETSNVPLQVEAMEVLNESNLLFLSNVTTMQIGIPGTTNLEFLAVNLENVVGVSIGDMDKAMQETNGQED